MEDMVADMVDMEDIMDKYLIKYLKLPIISEKQKITSITTISI